VQASFVALLAEGGVTVKIALRYRRGGGAVEAAMTRADVETQASGTPPAEWSLTLTAPGAVSLRLSTGGAAPAQAIIARERLCALADGGKLVLQPVDRARAVGEAAAPAKQLDFAAMDGAKLLIEEACP
jgi:hypothetical protein